MVGGATGYVVEIGIPPSAGGLVHTSHPTNDLSITIPNLLASQTYEYRVKATAEGRTGTWTTWATVVTSAPPPPPPPITSTWVDTGRTRNRVEGIWRDTGNQRENQILLIMEKEQTRTVTWEKEQIDSTGNVTEPQWIPASEGGDPVDFRFRPSLNANEQPVGHPVRKQQDTGQSNGAPYGHPGDI